MIYTGCHVSSNVPTRQLLVNSNCQTLRTIVVCGKCGPQFEVIMVFSYDGLIWEITYFKP